MQTETGAAELLQKMKIQIFPKYFLEKCCLQNSFCSEDLLCPINALAVSTIQVGRLLQRLACYLQLPGRRRAGSLMVVFLHKG